MKQHLTELQIEVEMSNINRKFIKSSTNLLSEKEKE